jgi:hypothetical protein
MTGWAPWWWRLEGGGGQGGRVVESQRWRQSTPRPRHKCMIATIHHSKTNRERTGCAEAASPTRAAAASTTAPQGTLDTRSTASQPRA